MNPILKTDKLNISFKKKELLRNISLEVFPGELIKLSGPNGCGKTTLIETLIGLRKTQNVSRNFSANEYGYLPQLSKVYPKMSLTLEEVSSSSYSFYSKELFSRHWSMASGGEKMKSLIARAFDQAEQILFLDEPFNHLDQFSCKLLTQYISEKVKSGLTVIYIGHQDFEIDQRVIEVDKWSC